MSTVQDTSRLAYIRNYLKLNGRRYTVYEAIYSLQRMRAPTDLEIARYLNYGDPNKVRPRRRELVQMGFIEEAGTRICSISHELVHTWRTRT